MKQFRIKENGFKEIRNKTLARQIPVSVIALTVGLFAFEYNNESKSDIYVYLLMIPLLIGALAFGYNKGIKRLKGIYNTYTLTIDDLSITREQSNTSSIRLLFTEIKKITLSKQGGIVVRGDSLANSILIPAQVDGLTDLEMILKEKCDCEFTNSKPFIQKLSVPLSILGVGSMVILYISNNKVLIGISGIFLIGLMIWSFITLQTNKSIDKRTKKGRYIIILVILSIIGIVTNKIFGL